jgi:hypothetical protein
MLAKFYLLLGSALLTLYAMSAFLGWEFSGSALSRSALMGGPSGGHGGVTHTGFRGGK